jgi:hypothetical protein
LTTIISIELILFPIVGLKTLPERSTICPGEYRSLLMCIFSSFVDIALSCGTEMLVGFDLHLEEEIERSAGHIQIEKIVITIISIMLIIIYDLYFSILLEYRLQSSFVLVKFPHL